MEAPWRVLQPAGEQVDELSLHTVDFDSLLWQLPASACELDFLLAPHAPLLGGGHGEEAADRAARHSGMRSEAQRGARQREDEDAGARTHALQRCGRGASDVPPRTHAGASRGEKRPRAHLHYSASPESSEQPQPKHAPPLAEAAAHAGALSVCERLARDVSPATASFVGRMHVSAFVLAARAEPHAPLATCSLRNMRALMQASVALSAVTTRHAAELRCTYAALRAAGDADAPAWLLGAAAPPHAESALHVLQQHTHAFTAALQDSASASRGYVAVLKRPLSAPERAHVADMTHALGSLHAFLSAAQSLLAELRCRRGAAADYLEASAGVLDLVGAMLTATHDTNRARLAEFGERAAATAAWPSPYLQHAAAAGVTLPPDA
jgi:hypothetical protein